ncbi:MAG: choice-of-anchor Q domain-containing protein, partial [Chloroflexota bacterium]
IDQAKEITIFGVGASRTKIGAGGRGRIFSIEGGAKVTLRNLSIVDGTVADGNGGGLLVNGTGSELVLQFVDLNKNVAQNGGGIAVTDQASLFIEDSSLQSNNAHDAGGGIYVQDGSLTVKRTLIYENQAAVGGGLFYASTLGDGQLENVTFGKNLAQISNSTVTSKRGGGGLFVENVANSGQGSILEINFTTIGENQSVAGDGGGILLDDGTINLRATVLFDNTADDDAENCRRYAGVISSLGYNVSTDAGCLFSQSTDYVSASVQLESIADNGGFSSTFEASVESQAIGTVPVNSGLCPDVDQRNINRKEDSTCDSGAYEAEKFMTFCQSAGAMAIPDGNMSGLVDQILINESFAIYDLAILMQVTNDNNFIDDLSATLTFSDAEPNTFNLISQPMIDGAIECNNMGPTTNNLRFSDGYSDQLTGNICFSSPVLTANYQPISGNLNDLVGQKLDEGAWELNVIDANAGATGTLENWCVQAKIKPDAFEVTRADDPVPDGCKVGDCSLREAISDSMKAPGRELINVNVQGPIVLNQTGVGEQEAVGNPDINDLDITEDVRIAGSVTDLITIDATNINDRIFDVFPGATFELEGFELSGGRVTQGSRGGAAILNRGVFVGAHLQIRDNVTENEFGYGAGIQSTGGSDFTLRYSEVISNSSNYMNGGQPSGFYGGIYNWNSMMELEGVTIAGNSGNGSVVFNNASGGDAVLVMRSVTLASNHSDVPYGLTNRWQNSSNAEHPEAAISYLNNSVIGGHNQASCSLGIPSDNSTSALISLGYNLSVDSTCNLTEQSDLNNTEPMFSLLKVDNSGSNKGRIVLIPNALSPIYNNGDPANCPSVDSRGTTRPTNGSCDIGAIELRTDEAPQIVNLPFITR